MKLRVIEVNERVPMDGFLASPPPKINITHYVPEYFDERDGWRRCYLNEYNPHPPRFLHQEEAIAVCKKYAKAHTPKVVWTEDTESDNTGGQSATTKKRINKCPRYDEYYGCATSPSKRCDGCPDAVWEDSEE